MRAQLKELAERAMIGSGIERVVRRNRGREALILAYHNVVPRDAGRSGDASLHLAHDAFLRQLGVLEESCEVVTLPSLLEQQPATDRLRIAITFDDAYADALRLAVPELARRGMPATIFVAPALLGKSPWWDVLANPVNGVIPKGVRDHALDSLLGRHDAILEWAGRYEDSATHIASLPRIGSLEELTSASRFPGITFGAHTWSHPNLAAIAPDDIEAELLRPLEWLRERFTCVIPWLSYPYGRFNKVAEEVAGATGYSAALRIDGGWFRGAAATACRYSLPRLNVPSGISPNGFRLRLAGLRIPA